MRTISFSVLKSKLQDGSKRQTTRPAFDVKILRKTGKVVDKPARFKVNDMARLYWKQRNDNTMCGDACAMFIIKEDYDGGIRASDINDCLLKLDLLTQRIGGYECFTKVFCDVKINDVVGININAINNFWIRRRIKVRDIQLSNRQNEYITLPGLNEVSLPIDKDKYLIDDGFDNPNDGEDFFLKTYPELKKMSLPYWCYKW